MSNKGECFDANCIVPGRDANIVRAGHDAINIVVHPGAHYHEGTASGSQNARRDSFQPSFHAPSNPREVVLDFGNPLDHTQPQTQEAKVLNEILRDDGNEGDTRIIGIHGKGGVGKSCILRALARHEKVKERFPDGVYFLSLGMDAGIAKLIDGLVEITLISGGTELGADLRAEDNLQIVLKKVREWMKGRKCLLLLDDFWERNGLGGRMVRELAEICSYGSRSAMALTTRFVSVATSGTEIEIHPEETTSYRAEAILLAHAKFEREEVEDETTHAMFDKLVEMCGGLPLFLSVIGRAVAELYVELKIERRLVWKVYWEIVGSQAEDILLETECDEYPDLGKTLRVSLEILCNGRGKRLGSLSTSRYSLFEMHRGLCVFKKQTAIPLSVCQVLWNVKSDEGAIRIAKGFADVGLGDIEVKEVGERCSVFLRLHDLVHIFATECAKEKNEVWRWHKRLLEGYSSRVGGGESMRRWWDVAEKTGEGYLFENLCRHLASSGNFGELLELLLSGEWTKLRHRHGGLSAWKQDFSEYMGREAIVALSEREKEIRYGLGMVRDAVVKSWAAVQRNTQDLGFQIFGRLVDSENSVVRKYLKSIQSVQRGSWLKPMQKLWKGGMIAEFNLGSNIQDIAVHKDPFIVVAAVKEEIVVINLNEMTVISRCIGHSREVRKVGISVDGRRVFSWSGDNTVRQWDVQFGKEDVDKCIRLDGGESDEDDWVTCAAFWADKSILVTGSRKGRVRMWDLCSGERIGRIMDAAKRVWRIEISPNGRFIVAGVHGGALQLWDVQTFRPLGTALKGYLHGVRRIAFSPDSRFVASAGGSGDFTIWLWDVENGTQIRDPLAHCKDKASSITFSEDGQRIISGHRDGLIIIWDVASGAAMHSWTADSLRVVCVAVTGDGDSRYAVSGGGEGILRVWNLEAAANMKNERIQHDLAVECVAASSDGRFFVSASEDKTLRIWNAADGTAFGGALCGHEKAVTCVAVSPDNRRLVSGSMDDTIRVWDVRTRAQVGDPLTEHVDGVSCVAYSGDGRFVLSGSGDCTARVWRAIDNPEVNGGVCEPASTGERVAKLGVCKGSSSREFLRLVMTLNHELPDEEWNRDRAVTAVTVSSDRQNVICGLGNGEIWVWDLSSGICLCRAKSDDGVIMGIDVSEKYEVVTVNLDDGVLRWRLDDEGDLRRVVESKDETGVTLAEAQEGCVSRGHNSVVCRDRTVRLGSNGKKIATLPHLVSRRAWKYDAERRVLCTGLRDGRVLFFRLEYDVR